MREMIEQLENEKVNNSGKLATVLPDLTAHADDIIT